MVALLTAVSNLDRMRVIAQTLARHGFGEVAARMNLGALVPGRKSDEEGGAPRVSLAERFRLVLQDLGPTFVKLGQVLSTRPDLFPADFVAELGKLQDAVPPIAIEVVRKEIEDSLGVPVEAVFETFDEAPLASASIGQVHRATLRAKQGGPARDVVVKVQRPNARETVERDLDLLQMVARLLERAVPESKIYSPVGLVDEFARAMQAELDYGLEAENARRFAANFAAEDDVKFPEVHAEASTRRVLTLELIPGLKLADALAAGFSGPRIAERAVGIIVKMIFEDGLFHADPHPGNLFILGSPERPTIALIDLGQVGRLTAAMRDKALQLVLAAARKDSDALADALLAIGRPRTKVDRRAFVAEVDRLSMVHLGRPLRDLNLAALVRDLVQGAIRFDIEMPSEVLLVGKSLMTVEGIGRQIHPDLDILAEARPHLERVLLQRYSPERLGNDLLRALGRLSTATGDLPGQVHEILEDLRSGSLALHTSDPAGPAIFDRLGRRLFAGLSVIALLGSGTALLVAGDHGARLLGGVLLALGGMVFLGHLARDLVRT